MSEVGDPVFTSNIYLDLESCSTVSEISQDEVQDSMRKSGLDSTLYREDHDSELMFEGYASDFEDASEKQMSPLRMRKTSPIMKDSSFITEWKESNEGLLDQGESEPQWQVPGWPEELYRSGEESDPEDSQEVTTKNAMQAEGLLVETSDEPIMGESLLDSIVKESPIVSSFLTQPAGSLLKTDVCEANEDLMVQWSCSNAVGKASDGGNMMESAQHNESSKDFQDSVLMASPDAVDENLDYIQTLMQSNRHFKEHLKSNIASCVSEKKVDDNTLLLENVENVSEEEHNTESSPLHSQKPSFMTEEGTQRDRGDKALSPTHSTKSCCLSPYGASGKLWNSPEFSPNQLPLQEGDMDFSKVIKDLGLGQQKDLPHILSLQYGNRFSEKAKEIEKLLLEEGDTDLNNIIQALEQGQKRPQIQAMDLYHCDVSLAKRFKEQEVDFFMKQNFIDTIRKLKENTADLIEAMSKVTEKKEEAEGCPRCRMGASGNTKVDLQDPGSEKKALVLQLEKLSADYRVLQEKHQAEVEEKVKYMAQCKELDCTLRKKEEEIQELNRVIQELEHEASSTTSALHKLTEESERAQKRSLSLEAELQREKDEWQAEREELGFRYNKLLAQIKALQVEFENERAEMEKMQQQVCAFRSETSRLQQEMAKDREENRFLQLESAKWREQYRQIREPQSLEEQMHSQMIQILRNELGLKREELRKKEEIIEWSVHILGRFLLNMKSMHSALSIRDVHGEDDYFNSPYVQKASQLLSKTCSLLALAEGLLTCQGTDNQAIAECSTENETVIEVKGKMKRLLFKKENLEKELRKHKENIAAMRELIINEKVSEDPYNEATEEESENFRDLPDLLRTKLNEYHKQSDELQAEIKTLEANLASKEEACKKLTGDNVELQKDLGNLTCKVASYEEIIECADKRLEQAYSEISDLKKRNQDLEDSVKKFKMNTRKLRIVKN